MVTQPRFLAIANPVAAPAPEPFRVAIVARDLVSRTALTAILGRFEDFAVEQLEADDFLVSRVRVLRPDAVLSDGAGSRDLHLIESPVVLILDDALRAAEVLSAGAHGVLLCDASPRRIHAALLAAAEGMVVIDEALRDSVLQHAKPVHELVEPLTSREQEVIQLLASGQTNKEIAKQLGVTEHTVKFHVNGILGKLGVATRTEAVVHAAKMGIVEL